MTTALSAEPGKSLIPAELMTPAKFATPQALSLVSKVGDYLPYVQLHGSSSNLVKEGKCPMGQYTVTSGKNMQVLGASFNCLLASWRPKAMRYSPSVLSFYDPNHPEFKKVVSDSAMPDSGCGYGPEYLLYIPDVTMWAALFLGNVSGRNAAGVVNQYMGQRCTFSASLAENKKKQKWHVVQANECNVEIALPDFDQMREVLEKFNNPPTEAVETVSDDTRAR